MNKKFTKLLSVFIMAGVIGTGAAFTVTGCKPKTPDQEQQQPGDDQKPNDDQGQTTEYTVTFNKNGHGTTQPEPAKTVNGKVTKPADLGEKGWKFEYWCTDEACTTEFNFDTVLKADTTLYAKWTEVVDLTPNAEGVVNISTPKQFVAFRELSELAGTTYKLTADIDLQGITLGASKAKIGDGQTFDGQGYAIKNATYANAEGKSGILCKEITGTGKVTNVRFLNCAVTSGNEAVSIVAGECNATAAVISKIEFNSCTVKGGNYSSLLYARSEGAPTTVTISEITAKNGCSVTAAQYGGLLVGDSKEGSTLTFENLDIAGELKGKSSNGAFLAGRCRDNTTTITVKNAVIHADINKGDGKDALISGGSKNLKSLTMENVLIVKNTSNAAAGYANLCAKEPGTKTLTNVYTVGIEMEGEGLTGTTGENTPAYLKDTLGFDFTADTGIWMTEGENDAKYRLRASSTNVRSAGATIEDIVVSTSNAKTRYKVGEDFTSEGLVVSAIYSDGVQLIINSESEDGYEIDSTAFDSADSHESLTITVKSKEDPTVTETYNIVVAKETGFRLYQDYMSHVYRVGDTELDKYYSVKSVWSDGIEETETEGITVEGFDTTTAGQKTVKLKLHDWAQQDIVINVVGSVPQPVEGKVYVNVDPTATITYEGEQVKGVETFKTVANAIDYLEACFGTEKEVTKVVRVAKGTYEAKITTSLNNLVLVGTGTSQDDAVLTYSAVEGTVNPVTDKEWVLECATLQVNGTGFRAYNIAIRNDFDYIKDASKYGSPQGLALTINGDQAVLEKVHLYGNQDTLYLKSGRTYAKDCLIEGNVDFIFGEPKGLAYFDECEIRAISRYAVDATNKNNNGYVTAMKASATDKPDYGYIFNKCDFTHGEGVQDSSMSLARTWGKKATVAFIDCKYSSAYSKNGYGNSLGENGKTLKERWGNMGGTPVEADFVEYFGEYTGTTGLTEEVAGGKVIDATKAADYNKTNIFAATNGLCTWEAAWDCDAALTALHTLTGAPVAANGLYASAETISVEAGSEKGLYLSTAPWNANDKAVTVSVADTSIATWSNGVLKGVAEGTTTITVSKTGMTDKTVAVTVTPAPLFKTYTITVAEGVGVVEGGNGVTVAYVAKSGATTSANKTDFKMDGGVAKVTLTIANAKAGQKISVKVSGFTGSNGSDVDLMVGSATNATGASTNPETIVFSAASTVDAQEVGTFEFTADAAGDVVIVLARKASKTTRIASIEVTVGQ